MRFALLLLLAGCAEELRDGITPVDQLGYKDWPRPIQVIGDAPGHTGFRIIYVNDLARDPTQSFRFGYQEGSIVVKEVYDLIDGAQGDLRHIAVMRRIGEVTNALENDGGWYYTEAKGDGPEQHYDFCFRRCHVAAPYNGAWLDYRD